MAKRLEQRTEKKQGRFIVALPNVDVDVPEYNHINHIGGTLATTEAGAVGNYLFRVMPHKARIVMGALRDRFGGTKNYAMRIPEEFEDDQRNLFKGDEKRIAEEIEVCCYLDRCYRRADQKPNPQKYLDKTRELLREFERLKGDD